jgi:RNA polymerase sigma-70 factor (ECF subfamily)
VSLSESELLARARKVDDPCAFGELVRRHQSTVRLFLRQLTHGDAALADDLAQDTFILAYRNLRHFRGDARFTTWLLGIANNVWRNERRKLQESALGPERLGDLEPSESTTQASDMKADVSLALDSLSRNERTALHLSYQDGLSHSEIATALGWPLGTVKTHLARAKDKLRPILATWRQTT